MKRELWLDYLRAFACILVTLGHLANSFIDAHFVSENGLLSVFVQIIYHFHVYIFYFCSGYLFQASFQTLDAKAAWKKRCIRVLDLLVPYIFFSFITYAIKIILSGSVNTPVDHSFLDTLINYPINQMWFLYALIIITFVTPVIHTPAALSVLLIISIAFRLIRMLFSIQFPAAVDYLLSNEIWYVLGMVFYIKKIKLSKAVSATLLIVFISLCLIEVCSSYQHPLMSLALTAAGILACVGFSRLIGDRRKTLSAFWRYTSKYMLQIYLLHTICAAGIRIVLMKLNIENLAIHTLAGLIFSFPVPIVCAVIAERIPLFNTVFFPSKSFKAIFPSRRVSAEK